MPFEGLVAMSLCVAFVHHVPACRISLLFIGSLLFGLAAAFGHHVPACRISLLFIGSLLFGSGDKYDQAILGQPSIVLGYSAN